MKKTAILLTLALCLSAAGCAPKDTPQIPDTSETSAEIQATQTVEVTETVPETTAEPETTAAPETAEIPEKDVEITMENWEQYFELRVAVDPYRNENGEIEDWSFGYGVFLRPEYVSRFESADVNFEVAYVTETHSFTADSATGKFTLGDKSQADYRPEEGCKTFALQDNRTDETLAETSDFYGTVAGRIYCGNLLENGDAVIPAQGKVLHAEGMLHFN